MAAYAYCPNCFYTGATLVMYPPGTLGILAGDLSRWNWFNQSLLGLTLPTNTQRLYVTGQFVAAAVNTLIRAMHPASEWLAIFADDHIFEPDMLLRLLDHHADIIAPLVCLRRPPFLPSLFHAGADLGDYTGYTWRELADLSGPYPVDTMGGPGVVIRREVLAAIGDPWFVCGAGEHPQEDLLFFDRCRRAGFQPYVDLDIEMGHCIPAAVFPKRTVGGDYHVRLWSHTDLGEMVAAVPQRQPAGAYHAST